MDAVEQARHILGAQRESEQVLLAYRKFPTPCLHQAESRQLR